MLLRRVFERVYPAPITPPPSREERIAALKEEAGRKIDAVCLHRWGKPMSAFRPLTPEDRQELTDLYNAGAPQRAAARHTDLNDPEVQRTKALVRPIIDAVWERHFGHPFSGRHKAPEPADLSNQ